MNELYNPVGMLMHARSPVAVLWLAQIGYATATWKLYSIHAKITLLYIYIHGGILHIFNTLVT